MRLTWPLTGRSEEMRLVAAALSDPGLCGIVIGGAAGVGKSRVVREALEQAATLGHTVRWVVGTSCARGLPLGAFAAWAGTADRDDLQLVCAVIRSLSAAPPGTAVVVGVDDVHLLDELSLFVLQQIAQRGEAKLILSIRDGEEIPVGVHELYRIGQFDRLDLEPLSLPETTALLSAALAGPVDPHAARRLWELTRGNALYLRHIVEQQVTEGRFGGESGTWYWLDDPIVVPHSLIELIESRMGALAPDVAAVIDTLAVGEPIALPALERMVGPDAVEDADARGLIRVDQAGTGPQVWVAHPLYGEVRRNRAAPTRLRRLRGLVATELGAADDRDDARVLVRRAAMSMDSDLTPDGHLLVTAARKAVALADLSLADRLASAAVHAGEGPEAVFIRAHALSWSGRGREAEALLAEMSVDGMGDENRARLAYLRASNLLWALADPPAARAIIDAASDITAGPAGHSMAALRTVYWFAVDRPGDAVKTAQHLELDDLPAIVGAETAWALTAIEADAGRLGRAVSVAEAGYAVATRSSDAPHMQFNIADAHLGALLFAGRVAEAEELAERVRRQADDLPGDPRWLGAAVAGRAALGSGHLDTACVLLAPAERALTASGYAIGWGYRYGVAHMTALAMRGSTAQAAALLTDLDARQRTFRSLDDERALALAWLSAGQGVVSEAMAMVTRAARTAAANGRFAAEVMCLQTAAQFGDTSCAARLGELGAIVEGPRARIAARLAAALRDHDAAELVVASEEFEAMGDLVAAVDAAAQGGVAYRDGELRGSFLTCLARAEALAETCGIIETPALRQAREPIPLTHREREIVSLLGHGLSNRDVAERLTLSVRTVEGHIYKAMSKTGTTSREELAALLTHRRPPT
ncbi:helix-turn-helix transcriptional regulator [Mycobacterium manitobense]|uniref:Helix-turn-helix transcriptional regulator n=1 Tax=[Mycobacterium] manitobense TaxID=190147 RepID=A0A9X3BWG2_9MYCO|nr:LuxR family transcriptional regulator [[Mycobacterium] manitobense]MCV7172713.1 helix-turn-helix transcriptional regulator [[Mycobacterium] manitobense]